MASRRASINKIKEAPAFYSLYTGLIVVGAGIILIPKVPLLKILVFSQVANGIWLPVVLIFILMLINRRDLMGKFTNTWVFNVVAWSRQHHHDHPHRHAGVRGDLRAVVRRPGMRFIPPSAMRVA